MKCSLPIMFMENSILTKFKKVETNCWIKIFKENPNTNSTNHDSLSLQKYIPKYQKKSGDNRHFSPPGYYRTRQQKLEESEHQQSSGDKACSFYEDRIMNKESTDASEGKKGYIFAD